MAPLRVSPCALRPESGLPCPCVSRLHHVVASARQAGASHASRIHSPAARRRSMSCTTGVRGRRAPRRLRSGTGAGGREAHVAAFACWLNAIIRTRGPAVPRCAHRAQDRLDATAASGPPANTLQPPQSPQSRPAIGPYPSRSTDATSLP